MFAAKSVLFLSLKELAVRAAAQYRVNALEAVGEGIYKDIFVHLAPVKIIRSLGVFEVDLAPILACAVEKYRPYGFVPAGR
jgi:hypothetical protein